MLLYVIGAIGIVGLLAIFFNLSTNVGVDDLDNNGHDVYMTEGSLIVRGIVMFVVIGIIIYFLLSITNW